MFRMEPEKESFRIFDTVNDDFFRRKRRPEVFGPVHVFFYEIPNDAVFLPQFGSIRSKYESEVLFRVLAGFVPGRKSGAKRRISSGFAVSVRFADDGGEIVPIQVRVGIFRIVRGEFCQGVRGQPSENFSTSSGICQNGHHPGHRGKPVSVAIAEPLADFVESQDEVVGQFQSGFGEHPFDFRSEPVEHRIESQAFQTGMKDPVGIAPLFLESQVREMGFLAGRVGPELIIRHFFDLLRSQRQGGIVTLCLTEIQVFGERFGNPGKLGKRIFQNRDLIRNERIHVLVADIPPARHFSGLFDPVIPDRPDFPARQGNGSLAKGEQLRFQCSSSGKWPVHRRARSENPDHPVYRRKHPVPVKELRSPDVRRMHGSRIFHSADGEIRDFLHAKGSGGVEFSLEHISGDMLFVQGNQGSEFFGGIFFPIEFFHCPFEQIHHFIVLMRLNCAGIQHGLAAVEEPYYNLFGTVDPYFESRSYRRHGFRCIGFRSVPEQSFPAPIWREHQQIFGIRDS
jgi:hypothetical protein